MRTRNALVSIVAAICALPALGQTPLGSEFTWQARVAMDGQPLNGTADFQFKLFSAVQGGAQVGATQALNNVAVSDGLVTAELDFGPAAFNGDERFLEITVRSPAGGGQFQALAPRQPLTGAPYALKVPGVDGHSLNAADGSPVDAVFVDSTGKVGIGTSTPERVLHTVGDAVLIERAENTPAVMLRNTLNGQVNAQFGLESTGPNDGYAFVTDQSLVRTLLLRNGNVGIGTTTPGVPLHLVSDALAVMILQDPGSASTQAGYVSYRNAVAETGWVGYGTPGSPHFSVVNARSGGDVVLSALGAGGDIVLSPGAGGVVTVPVLEITGADIAERFPTSESCKDVEPGTVMAIDPKSPGKLCIARGAYNRCVAGIVSGANDLSVGAVLGNLPGHENAPAIALSGRVYVRCDASTAAIEPGDLLTTSDTAGHAMKAADNDRAYGAVIGKAMTSLAKGETGMVLVLVSLH